MARAKHSNGRLFRFLTGSPDRIDKQYSVGLRTAPPGLSMQEDQCMAGGTAKTAALPEECRSRFSATKITGSVLADPCAFPHSSSSPDLRIVSSHIAFSGFPNDRLSSNVGASTHTVAVPSGILTRFSILLRRCYRIRRHSNGIFTCEVSIHDATPNVNRKKVIP